MTTGFDRFYNTPYFTTTSQPSQEEGVQALVQGRVEVPGLEEPCDLVHQERPPPAPCPVLLCQREPVRVAPSAVSRLAVALSSLVSQQVSGVLFGPS